MTQDELKQAVADAALEYIRPRLEEETVLGIGTGSTANRFIDNLGAISGLIIGLVTAGVAWLWYGNPYLGVVIGLGMVVNLICAGLSGASIPLAMKKVGIDPAQSSSIILTTVTDVVGFMAFLGFAVLFQQYLVG